MPFNHIICVHVILIYFSLDPLENITLTFRLLSHVSQEFSPSWVRALKGDSCGQSTGSMRVAVEIND